MTSAKICGLSTPETLDAAIRGGASHVGFVFYPASPRHLSRARSAQLAARVPGHVRRVGVFVDPDDATIEAATADGQLEILQLHKVNATRAAAIKAKTRLEIWGAVAVKTRTDLNAAQGFGGAVDRILYDAKTPPGATLPGGMGVRFDWTLLEGFRHPLPWALSGGLDPLNVGDAIRQTGASLVDVSSGVEREPGIKDSGKIAAFLEAVAAR
ncbi:phosphoribosylanthranilate isomerase [Sphingomonas sp. AR_OL41]|uniref:phosphoribosylanthranilate isomerase n=1 Tax=Sphingomonas sp. AR_OL41 TaxID=3042729 RepID=UPI00248180E8|nr:phosphoribosylanthranilate isomerase [Sphingomonas sp. AR_OL41]MDH7970563.1 phosphoribosylanthranilate isomerase [Sphingomonas sp. AR_OL41]